MNIMPSYINGNSERVARLPTAIFEPVTLQLYSGGSDLVDGRAVSSLMALFSRDSNTYLRVVRGDFSDSDAEIIDPYCGTRPVGVDDRLVVACAAEETLLSELDRRDVEAVAYNGVVPSFRVGTVVVNAAFMRAAATGGGGISKWLCEVRPDMVMVLDSDVDLKGKLVHPISRAADIIEDSALEKTYNFVGCAACCDTGMMCVGAHGQGTYCSCPAGMHRETIGESTVMEDTREEYLDELEYTRNIEDEERAYYAQRESLGLRRSGSVTSFDWTSVATPEPRDEECVMVHRVCDVVDTWDELCPTCYAIEGCDCYNGHLKGVTVRKVATGVYTQSGSGAVSDRYTSLVSYDPSGLLRRRPSLQRLHPSSLRVVTVADTLVPGLRLPDGVPVVIFPVPMRLSVTTVMGAVWLDADRGDVVYGCLTENISQGDPGYVIHDKAFDSHIPYDAIGWRRTPVLMRNAFTDGRAPSRPPSFPNLGLGTVTGCLGQHFAMLASVLTGSCLVGQSSAPELPLVWHVITGGVYKPSLGGEQGSAVTHFPPAQSWADRESFAFGRLVESWFASRVR